MTTEERRAQPFDVVNKAKHYNSHPSGVEVKEITNYLEFNLGNVYKYAMRYQDKEPVRSLKSAMWYLNEHRDTLIGSSDVWKLSQKVLLKAPEYAAVQQALLRVIDQEPNPLVKPVWITYRAYVFGGYTALHFFDLKAALSGLTLAVEQERSS